MMTNEELIKAQEADIAALVEQNKQLRSELTTYETVGIEKYFKHTFGVWYFRMNSYCIQAYHLFTRSQDLNWEDPSKPYMTYRYRDLFIVYRDADITTEPMKVNGNVRSLSTCITFSELQKKFERIIKKAQKAGDTERFKEITKTMDLVKQGMQKCSALKLQAT